MRSAYPLADLTLGADDGLGAWRDFDVFTPHIRVLSLGGVRVYSGGWTAGELALAMRRVASDDAETIAAHGDATSLYAQLSATRVTWVSSLLGLIESRVGVALLDGRCGESWLERSVEAVCAELKTWREARRCVGDERPLSLLLWVERPTDEAASLSRAVERAIHQLERFARIQRADLERLGEGAALSDQEDARRLWSGLRSSWVTLGSAEELWSEQRVCVDSFTVAPRGEFYQGGRRLSASAERPKHRVKLTRPLWVSQAPITERLWSAVMGEAHAERGDSHHPASMLSWFDALRFCNRLSDLEGLANAYEVEDHELPRVVWRRGAPGYRLLTESEWEYVCRGGVISSPTSTEPPLPVAWTAQRARLTTHAVAQLDPNPWGVYDCLGNVAEWCQDTYNAEIYKARAERRLNVDPCESTYTGGERVTRGGGFDAEPYFATPSRREPYEPSSVWSNLGLRVARPMIV